MALDVPDRVVRLGVLNVIPTVDQFERMGLGPSLGYWPWFLLAQPAPFPEGLIAAAPEHVMWGTDWPHPNKYVANPNDADLVDALADWVPDQALRRRILVENPATFYRF